MSTQLKILISSVLLLYSLNYAIPFSAFDQRAYKILPDQTLSEIAYKMCRKVYGKTGLLRVLKKLNPHIVNPDQIRSGEKVNLPTDFSCPLPHDDSRSVELKQVLEEKTESKESIPSKNNSNNDTNNNVEEKNSSFLISPSLFFKSIQPKEIANNSKATIASKPMPGIALQYLIPWDSTVSSTFHLNYHQEDFRDGSSKKINSPSLGRFELQAKFEKKIYSSYFMGVFGFIREKTFIGNSTTDTVNLEKSSIPGAGLSLTKQIAKFSKRSAFLELQSHYLGSTTTSDLSIKSGIGYGASLHLKDQFRNHPLGFRFIYDLSSQNTNLTEQSDITMGMFVDFYFKN